jgi:hypothetical protein
MVAEVDYIPFAIGAGANVYSPATYQALAIIQTGVEPGLADPQLANTTWRLASMMSAALANFISNALGGVNILDDGNLSNLVTNLTNAISTGAQTSPSRTITASTAFNILTTDGTINMARVAGVAACTGTLPAGAAVGQKFKIADIVANFGVAGEAVTIAAPGGHNIAGLTEVILNVNRKTAEFQYAGNSTWSVEGVF